MAQADSFNSLKLGKRPLFSVKLGKRPLFSVKLGNCRVGFDDFAVFADHWLECGPLDPSCWP